MRGVEAHFATNPKRGLEIKIWKQYYIDSFDFSPPIDFYLKTFKVCNTKFQVIQNFNIYGCNVQYEPQQIYNVINNTQK